MLCRYLVTAWLMMRVAGLCHCWTSKEMLSWRMNADVGGTGLSLILLSDLTETKDWESLQQIESLPAD